MWYFIHSTCLPAPEAESLPTSCSDTDPSARSKLSSIRETCCCDTSLPENFLTSLFGTMLEVSQSITTQQDHSSNDCAESEKTSVYRAGSLVKTFPLLEKAKESAGNGQDFGKSLPESFAKFDRDTCSWKTPTSLLGEGLTLYSLTLPKWGILLRGELYQLPTLARLIFGKDSGRLQEREREREISDSQSGRLETAGSRSSDKAGVARPSILRQILPNSNGARRETINARQSEQESLFRPSEIRFGLSDAGNKNNGRLFGEQEESDEQSKPDCGRKTFNVRGQRRQVESRLGGIADGLSDWLDDCRNGTLWTPDEKGLARIAVDIPNRAARLKAIGNAQVPLCAAVAFETLKEILDNYDC